jgi:hypothetical protein
LEAHLQVGPNGRGRGRRNIMRKVLYTLMSLAAFAMAVGAGWKPN